MCTGVRKLILAVVPSSAEDLVQRIGRAVRFMGHARLPPSEWRVHVQLCYSSYVTRVRLL